MHKIEFETINVLFSTSLGHVLATAETKDAVAIPESAEKPEVMEDSATGEKAPVEEAKPIEKEESKAEVPVEDVKEEKKEENPDEKQKEDTMPEESMEKAPMEEGGAVTGEAAVMEELPSVSEEEMAKMGMNGGMEMPGAKFSLMQNTGALIGITAGVLALGILAGMFFAKLKIKKGINLYED